MTRLTNPTPADVPDVVVEAALPAWAEGRFDLPVDELKKLDEIFGHDSVESMGRAIAAALDAWPRGALLKRVLTVECGECIGSGKVSVQVLGGLTEDFGCPTCHGRGRVLSDEAKAVCARRASGDAELQAEYEAFVWALVEEFAKPD